MADYDLITDELLAAANARPPRDDIGERRNLPADAILLDEALRPTAPGWQLNPPRLLRQIELLRAATSDSRRAVVMQPDAALLAHLDAVQSEVLRTRISASFSTLAGMTLSDPVCEAKEIDRGCVVLLAHAFERLFRSRELAAQAKLLIAPLQLPILRAALLDRSFYLDAQHPARALLCAIAGAVAGQSETETDQALCRVVDTCTRTLLHSTGEPTALFVAMRTRFMHWLEIRLRERGVHLAPQIAKHEQAETLAFAQAEVERRLQRRFELADIDADLAAFLRGPWRDVLIRRCIARDTDARHWQGALESTDTLVWSVLPKSNSLERAEMLRTLPALVQYLNEELDRIGWTGAAREEFMRYLMDAHARVVRMPPRTAAARRLAQANGLHDGDTRPGDAASNTLLDVVRLPQTDAPQPGDWFILHPDDAQQSSRLQICWVSPMRTKLVLAPLDGLKHRTLTASEVISMLHAGTLRRMETSQLIEAALCA